MILSVIKCSIIEQTMNSNLNLNIVSMYQKVGWAVVKNFFKKQDIKIIKSQILEKISKTKNNDFFYFEKIKNKKKLRRIERISDFSDIAKKTIYSKKILKLINDVKGKNYDLFKDKLNFKYPGGKGYLPHVDGHFFWKDKNDKTQKGWKKYSSDFVNIVIPLEKSNKENGCLYLASNKHLSRIGNSFNEVAKKMIPGTPNIKFKDKKKFKYSPVLLDVGDICIFDWKCAHYSENNNSNKSRMIFYATYYKKNRQTNIRDKYYLDKKLSLNDKNNKSLLFDK